jgi:Heparan-alpha-glucosaminide N-acetyltransferase, catalytic
VSSRSHGADALRGIAMLAMTFTHSLRILAPAKFPWLATFLMTWEPVIPTLFTLLLGYGMAQSAGRTKDIPAWVARQRTRALWLCLISAALFLVRFGPQWPALLTSTGILLCLSICILAITVVAPSGGLSVGFGALLFLAWTGMEGRGIHIDGLNQGSFPVFPYLPMALLAFGAVRLLQQNAFARIAAIALGVMATGHAWNVLGWGHLGTPDSGVVINHQIFLITRLHQEEGFSLFWDLLCRQPAQSIDLAFWHTRPELALFLLVACGTAATMASALLERTKHFCSALSLAGRHSLPYYVVHFALLGVGLALPEHLARTPWAWLVASLASFAVATAGFHLLERFRKQHS